MGPPWVELAGAGRGDKRGVGRVGSAGKELGRFWKMKSHSSDADAGWRVDWVGSINLLLLLAGTGRWDKRGVVRVGLVGRELGRFWKMTSHSSDTDAGWRVGRVGPINLSLLLLLCITSPSL